METLRKTKTKASRKAATPPDRLLLRLPYELRELIQTEAKRAGRTMTAEILMRIESSYNFDILHIEQALHREYIILKQVERAITRTLRNSHADQSLEGKESGEAHISKLSKAIDSLSIIAVRDGLVRSQANEIDLVITDTLALNASKQLNTLCWRTRIALGKLITDPSERDYEHTTEIRHNLQTIALLLKEHIKIKTEHPN
jgi:hypothetical protein